ncbi:glycosyltransferase family 2 protein [Carboxylicivirga sp. M1479]|uniref:glycosyltransferase family 2 protein n=1 Tax=Carboxylicivirga sp. M1479 TaxID=2594476 RepID=UPI001178C072|nr:glycosyltransferase family 2 protein [Carboxylicivirga sp. M1479]TRX70893.1 glycosyltransferase family 2 protein [Carboxylicivirga sp. M1479]
MNQFEFELSIVIVSYNAPAFLKLTLDSVKSAIQNNSIEVLLVDNSNNQELIKLVQSDYPFVKIIQNTKNLGFAKANNLALKNANGQLALLLNPDTLVAEDTFSKIITFHTRHPETNGLGVKMLDGNGEFLKESKRGFPKLTTSLYKIFGLYKWRPQSQRLAKYYEGHLPIDEQHQVDILSGAFLAMPRDNKGNFTLLDESFFMYGEDIDLSCRLQKKNQKNTYLPQCPIIHFKGQSTKHSLSIVWHFYHSMWLFYKLHIKQNKSIVTNFTVWLSIKLLTALKLVQAKAFGPSKPTPLKYYQSIVLISDDKQLLKKLQETLHESIIMQDSLDVPKQDQLTIFDFNLLKYKTVIEHLETHPSTYGYLPQDKSTLIISDGAANKGHVIHLQ